jgi:tetratricopeptide (TPR) repeat protein
LSFTHFQNAFLQQTQQREREVSLAFEIAAKGLEVDPTDPAAHWAMGRAPWLHGAHEGAVGSLNQSVRLSPSYVLAHYNLAMVHCQTGDPARAIEADDMAACLSPLDPMLFAIHGARTFALLRLGRVEEAAQFAILGARQPNAHVHAHAIAGLTLATAGRIEDARVERKRIGDLRRYYTFKQFKDASHLLAPLPLIERKGARQGRTAVQESAARRLEGASIPERIRRWFWGCSSPLPSPRSAILKLRMADRQTRSLRAAARSRQQQDAE